MRDHLNPPRNFLCLEYPMAVKDPNSCLLRTAEEEMVESLSLHHIG
jgi:hypothetical protein